MGKDQEQGNPKSGRQRALNIIYFIDAHKTRSFHLALGKVYIGAIIAILICSWSVASLYYVLQSLEEKEALNDRLHAALATIFEYQSRYDGVYELAYPEVQVNKETPLLTAQGPVVNTEKAEPPPASVPKTEAPTPTLIPQDLNNLSGDKILVTASSEAWPVVVEDINIHRDQDELELSFAIRNRQSPSRAEGYIWSVATLVNPQGEVSYLGSPRGLKPGDDGLVSEPSKHGNWYSIRYYKAKNFYFTLPSQWNGTITKFAINMMDTSGKQSSFTIALQANPFADQPAPTVGASPQESAPRGKVASTTQNAGKIQSN